MNSERTETIICTGYSRLPDGMAAKNLYGVMGVGFEIDPATDKIINVSCTFVTDMCTSFMKDILAHHDLKEGIEAPIGRFESRYFGLGKKAVVMAIRDAYNQFEIYKSMKTAE